LAYRETRTWLTHFWAIDYAQFFAHAKLNRRQALPFSLTASAPIFSSVVPKLSWEALLKHTKHSWFGKRPAHNDELGPGTESSMQFSRLDKVRPFGSLVSQVLQERDQSHQAGQS
jgi:hypothetical protein